MATLSNTKYPRRLWAHSIRHACLLSVLAALLLGASTAPVLAVTPTSPYIVVTPAATTVGAGAPITGTATIYNPDGTVETAADITATWGSQVASGTGSVSFSFPTTASNAGSQTITGTTIAGGATPATAGVTVVGVGGIQFFDGQNWDNNPTYLNIFLGQTVQFRAVPIPAGASFPAGCPVWGGTAGATGSSTTISVPFNAQSANATTYTTVTVATSATSSDTQTTNVLTYSVDIASGAAAPDNFAGHSTAYFGLGETANVSLTTAPNIVNYDYSRFGLSIAGAANWSISTPTAIVQFLAPGAVTVTATFESGLSVGKTAVGTLTAVPPDAGQMSNYHPGVQYHTINEFGTGFMGQLLATPVDVGFPGVLFKEGTCSAQTSGWFTALGASGLIHVPNSPTPLGAASISTATSGVLLMFDQISTGPLVEGEMSPYIDEPVPFYAPGTIEWQIPWYYSADSGGTWNEITAAIETAECTDSLGTAVIWKYNSPVVSSPIGDASANPFSL